MTQRPGPTTPTSAQSKPYDPLLGQQVGNVRIQRQLGQGGFGTVYAAEHVFIGISFAVKILRLNQQANAKVVARFQREARALATLKHPNIVQFYDFGELPRHGFYMVMEHLEGESLSQRLRILARKRCCYSLPALKRLFCAMFDVCHYIHRKGVVHRDIKPSNIYFHCTEEGEEEVKLLDFGIVSVEGEENQLTETGVSLGTASYLSPEQARSRGALDGRSDIYSLGVLLHRMLTSRLPFRGENALDTILKHIQDPPPSLKAHAAWKPWSPQLEDLLQRMLAKEPDQRPPDAMACKREFLEAFSHQEQVELHWLKTHLNQTIHQSSAQREEAQAYLASIHEAIAPPDPTKQFRFVSAEEAQSSQEKHHVSIEIEPLPTPSEELPPLATAPWLTSLEELDLPEETTITPEEFPEPQPAPQRVAARTLVSLAPTPAPGPPAIQENHDGLDRAKRAIDTLLQAATDDQEPSELSDLLKRYIEEQTPSPHSKPSQAWMAWLFVAIAALALLGILGWWYTRPAPSPVPRQTTKTPPKARSIAAKTQKATTPKPSPKASARAKRPMRSRPPQRSRPKPTRRTTRRRTPKRRARTQAPKKTPRQPPPRRGDDVDFK